MLKSEFISFYRELGRCFPEIGMAVPSSKVLARSLVKPVRHAINPLSILEVGPGTGPITREILRTMKPQDSYVICEINPRFIKQLKDSLSSCDYYKRNKERVTFFEGPVQSMKNHYEVNSFNVVISTLPFYNFPAEVVDEIFQVFSYLLYPGGELTFIEYLITRQIGNLFSSHKHRIRVKAVQGVINRWMEKIGVDGETRKDVSFFNVPPTLVYYLRFPEVKEDLLPPWQISLSEKSNPLYVR